MQWEMVALILSGFAASAFLVPHQIMLASSNRIGVPFDRFRREFRFGSPLRIVVAITGLTATLALGHLAAPVWPATMFVLALVTLYLLDFYQVEQISRKLTRE